VIIQVLILFIPAVVILLIYSGLSYTSLISFAFSFILIFLVVILPVKSLDKDDIITIYQMYNLSDGQKQRTAIARTLVNDPKIILADEPTGTLDSKNASLIMYVFKEFNNSGKMIILVTHDNDVAKVCKNSL
jgi:alpha-D-ribose 1-methylphosphonate 5-triphosphate synthase subunit PhnL